MKILFVLYLGLHLLLVTQAAAVPQGIQEVAINKAALMKVTDTVKTQTWSKYSPTRTPTRTETPFKAYSFTATASPCPTVTPSFTPGGKNTDTPTPGKSG